MNLSLKEIQLLEDAIPEIKQAIQGEVSDLKGVGLEIKSESGHFLFFVNKTAETKGQHGSRELFAYTIVLPNFTSLANGGMTMVSLVNELNTKTRFGKFQIDDEGDISLSTVLLLAEGEFNRYKVAYIFECMEESARRLLND